MYKYIYFNSLFTLLFCIFLVEQLRRALKRNSFHKEVVNTTITSAFSQIGNTTKNQNEKNIRDSATKERIMQALIFCIHKVIYYIEC